MNSINILGYGENVLSMVIETLKANGYNGVVNIIQNIELENKIPYMPSGMEARVIFSPVEEDFAEPTVFLFGVANPEIKQTVYQFFNDKHQVDANRYANLFHPSSVMASSVTVNGGCYIEPLSVVSPFTKIGFGVTINRKVSIGHHVTIGNYVTINPGADIGGGVQIGEASTIGMGAKIFDKITIGKNTVIGGGSVVTKDVPDNVIAWGNPCRVMKTI